MSDKTETAIGEIKTLIVDLNQTVKGFDMKLDRVEKNLTNMVEEVKNDVVKVIKDLKGAHDQIGSLREDHSELERGVAAMEIQLNELGNHKLALVRKNIESSLSELREKQILLEKHERKYNVLI
jgi:chromosome segregation ATPase